MKDIFKKFFIYLLFNSVDVKVISNKPRIAIYEKSNKINLGIKNKLLLVFVIISLCVLIIIGSFLAFSFRSEKLQTIQQDYQNQLKYADFAISNFLNEVENDVQFLSSMETVRVRDDKDFTNFLNADAKTFQYNFGKTEQTIIDIFNNYRLIHPFVNAVYMGRENGSFVRSHKWPEPIKYDPRVRPWYILAKETSNKVVMTDPYSSLSIPDINIGIEKALVDENGKVFGVVGMDVTLKNLTDYISSIKVGKNGRAILVNEKGTILASRIEEEQLRNILTIDKENLKVLLETTQGYTAFTEDSKRNYLFFSTSPSLGWKIGFIIPVEEIDREVWASVLQMLLALACTLILFSIVTLIWLQKFVVRPLKKLSNITGSITDASMLNNYNYIETKSQDEIGYLARSFNIMIDNLKKSNNALKTSEKALRKLNSELEEKVYERTDELTHANSRLKELDHLKSMFISSMSHELRTPLNSIIGFTSIILKGMTGKITSEQRKQLNMVKSSADHLLELITDVIDVSKIEADKIELSIEDFDLPYLIQEVKNSFVVITDKKGLRLILEIPERLLIRSDRRRVKQIIMNLVSNAIKFTEEGKIEINVEKKDGKAYISVADSGMGIKKEDMQKLFKQFSRIHNINKQIVEGTGLGLYLSEKMAHMLRGNIRAESNFGTGSVFTLTLPLKYEEAKDEEDSGSRR
jgi:signal transduction histidine kinase